ncbi:MAG: DnaJ domain-containing protein, partial [Deltaproteobacteria bacterium]|nr:DnaJ domain-containing protein [Kofleriaceae bacterium]
KEPARPAAKEPARAVRRAAANADQIREVMRERLALLDGGADHFALLGVTMDASPDEIRRRYFALARHLHPDRLEAAGIADEKKEAQRLFARMNEAFTTLTDPDKRHAYTQIQKAGGEAAVKAREAATEAAVRRALDAEERFRLGEMALRRQQLEVAVREFQKAIELNPDESDHHAMLGWAMYVAAGNKTAALPTVRGHLLTAMDRNKKSALPHLYLGRIARMENNLAEAEKHLTRALELSPGHVEATAELRAVQSQRPPKPPVDKGSLFSRLTKKP